MHVRVKCLAQEHNTMSPARAQTEDERTNHEDTVKYCSFDQFNIIDY